MVARTTKASVLQIGKLRLGEAKKLVTEISQSSAELNLNPDPSGAQVSVVTLFMMPHSHHS